MSDNEIRHECGHTDSEHAELFGPLQPLFDLLFGDDPEPEPEPVDEMADVVVYAVLFAVTRPTMDQDILTTNVAIGKTSNHVTSKADIPKIISISRGFPVEWITVLDVRPIHAQ